MTKIKSYFKDNINVGQAHSTAAILRRKLKAGTEWVLPLSRQNKACVIATNSVSVCKPWGLVRYLKLCSRLHEWCKPE